MDVETKEFLVKYEKSSKVVKFSGEGTLKNKIKKTFGISNDKEIKLQLYHKEWDDYIDISDSEVEVLLTHEKLKCEVDMVNNTVCSDSASDCASASGSSCSSSIVHTQSNFLPEQFVIPTHKYSKMLERNLKEEKQLNWSNKHELLQILVDEIFKYTYYPKTVEIMLVAKCLIDTHPYLTEKLGNGYDGWIQIIRDKLKNARRGINDPSVVWYKRKNSENKQDTHTGKRKRITPKGKNCLAGHPPGEDDTSCKMHVENLKKEMKNPQRDMELIQELMAKTFGYRRRFINECPPVSSVIAEYPTLKLCDVMKEEMSRLEPKETDYLKSFLQNCVRYSGGLIEVARKKKGSACHKALKDMDDEIDRQTEISPAVFGNLQCLTSLVLIPELLGDENKMFINCYEEDTSLETVCKGPRTPYVAVIGSALKPTGVYIVTEGEVVNTVRDLKEGLFYALCAYYVFNIEYPAMDLLLLPDVVLRRVLIFVGVSDCIQNVSRVCKYLHSFIENTSYIWTHFSFEEHFFDPFLFTSTNQLQSIFKHAKCFHCFDVPGICFENIFVASQFDTILNNSLISSSCLEWLDLSSAPVKSLDFLKGCPKLKTLVLGDCTLIKKESFENLSHCVNLCYLDAGFTQLNGETLAKSVPPSMVNLELCAVKFNMGDLQTVVLKCKKLLSIKIELESNVSIEEFKQFVRQYDVCFSLWQPHFWY